MSNDSVSITELDLVELLIETHGKFDSHQGRAEKMMKKFRERNAKRQPVQPEVNPIFFI